MSLLRYPKENGENSPNRTLSLRVSRHSKKNKDDEDGNSILGSNDKVKKRNSSGATANLKRTYSLKTAATQFIKQDSESETSSESDQENVKSVLNIENDQGKHPFIWHKVLELKL